MGKATWEVDSYRSDGCSSPRSYAQLRALWYAKLRESGFVDIELADGTLKDRQKLDYAHRLGCVVRQANSEYFAAAAAYLHCGMFRTEAERLAWELHADGLSVREIGAHLTWSKDKAQRIVSRHRELMGQADLKGSLKSSPARET